jgi:2-hydroxy-3-oxopropionate reductase
MKYTVGFIGLGNMGLPMAVNILKKSGGPVLGADVIPASLDKFEKAGGTRTKGNQEIYEKCNLIFLSLPKNEIVESVINEIIAVKKEHCIIVDTSSTAPSIIRKLFPKAKAKGIDILDSPVSGGVSGAEGGTLAIMVGGDKAVFDEVKPYLEYMGSSVTYMGSTGCGDIAKLANNMIVGIHLIAMGEAFAFAKKAGLDPTTLYNAIKGGFAQSAVLDGKAMKMIHRDFTASARIAVHYKDIKNAKALADEMGVPVPATDIVLDYMRRMDKAGLINEDQCALVKVPEKDMNVVVK